MGFVVSLSNDANRLWASGDRVLRIYDLVDGTWVASGDFSEDYVNWIMDLAVSADGRTFLAGDPDRRGSRGEVFVYQHRTTTSKFGGWTHKGGKLTGNFTGERFGRSVGINGNGTTIAVGAVGRDYVEIRNFVDDDEDWKLSNRIDGKEGSDFATSLSLSSDATTLIVGAHSVVVGGLRTGAAFAYSLDQLSHSFVQRMGGRNNDDKFGMSVAVSDNGNVVSIGAPDGDYVETWKYDRNSRTYAFIFQIQIVDLEFGSWFGMKLSLSANGRRLAVGAPYDSEGGAWNGKTYVYAVDNHNHRLIFKSVGDNRFDFSGQSVYLSGDGRRLAIGAFGNDAGGLNSGSVRVYEFSH